MQLRSPWAALPFSIGIVCSIGIATLVSPGAALAQGHEGVAASGMGQGHASVGTRDDVSMQLESVPGTGAARLQALGQAASGQMATVRQCYATVARSRPIVGGAVAARLELPAEGAPTVTIQRDEVQDPELVTCVTNALRGISTTGIERPAAAQVVLQFQNTASRSAALSQAAQEAAEVVTIDRSSGSPVAQGEGQSVRYEVRGAADATDAFVSDAFRVVRSQIAALLDCRRRASRRGRDPSGTIDVELTLTPGRPLVARVLRGTVADPMAPRCLQTKLGRAPRRPVERGRATLVITFER